MKIIITFLFISVSSLIFTDAIAAPAKKKHSARSESASDYKGKVDLSEDDDVEDFQAVFNDATDQIYKMKNVTLIEPCSALAASSNPDDIKCIQKYAQIYNKPVVDFRIVFGYLDTQDGYTSDLTLREALVAILTTPCPVTKTNIFACGLEKDPDDADKFYKEIIDYQGGKHKVAFTIVNSSYSYSEIDNLKFKEEQNEQTNRARKAYLEGLKDASVLIYNGHSRDGGGPDFNPPVLKKNNHVDYNWYHQNKPGLKDVMAAIEEGKREGKEGPSIIGLNSCNSHKHFFSALSQSMPKTSLLMTTHSSYFVDEPYTSIGMINAILGQFCEPSFSKSINVSPKIDKSSRIKAFNFP